MIGAAVLLRGMQAPAQDIQIVLRTIATIPTDTIDQHGRPFTIAGLSGITYAGDDQFIAVMDNSDKLVKLAMRFEPDGSLGSLEVTGGVTLAHRRDFEGIVYRHSERPTVLLSEEDTPAVHEYRLDDGAQLTTLETPRVFTRGRRPNFGFESLTAGRDSLWTTNEEALQMDGERSSVEAGSLVRLLRYDRRDGQYEPAAQYAYRTEPIHKPHDDEDRRLSRSGLVELVALPDDRVLALERSFARLGRGMIFSDFRNSIYLIDLATATDITAAEFDDGLVGKDLQPVDKALLWSQQGLSLGNLEGLCLGPELAPGRWVLVGVIDNGGIQGVLNRTVLFEMRISPDSAR